MIDRLLHELEACPDEQVCERFGIGENYDILIKGDFKSIVRDLYHSGRWVYNPAKTLDSRLHDIGEHRFFDYIDGIFLLQVLSWPMPVYQDETKEGQYNCSFVLVYSDGEKNATQLPYQRIAANAVCDLIRYIKDKQLPAYFAKSKLDGQPVSFIP